MDELEQQLTCEEARLFMSRELDGDLDRGEIRRLYSHLGKCEACRNNLLELASLESRLEELNRLYEQQTLGEPFNERVKVSIAGLSQESLKTLRAGRKVSASLRQLFSLPWARSPQFAGLVGVAAGFLLALLLWPDVSPVAPRRFQLHPIDFHTAQDKHDWNHDHILPPGHTLRKTVQRGHDQAYHFRFQSQGPVNVVITHDDPEIQNDPEHKFTLHGVRYASLHAPRVQDVIVIRNEGTEPVRISALTAHPDDLSVKLERHKQV